MRSFTSISSFVVLSLLSSISNAAPAPIPEPLPNSDRGLLRRDLEDTHAKLLRRDARTPSSKSDAISRLTEIFKSRPIGYTNTGLNLSANGFHAPDLIGATIFNPAPPNTLNSYQNTNPAPPSSIYPTAIPQDPEYVTAEAKLRAAIYIPPGTNPSASPKPILFVPGSATMGGINYSPNMLKLVNADPSLGQPYILNVPKAMLDDIQINAEYIAYAINYINKVTGSKVSVVGWSQGNLATQWVLKYWQSARAATKQLISFSADFHGTTVAYLLAPGVLPLPPAVVQQARESMFISTMRSNGGDSAYVPTTSLYSSVFDEIVQPQVGVLASAYMRDDRNVGVLNAEIQAICPLRPAGILGTHESLLFNGLTVALAIDALKNGGPAKLSRVNLASVCNDAVYPALNLDDVLFTEGLIPLAGANILEAETFGVNVEPPVLPYALARGPL